MLQQFRMSLCLPAMLVSYVKMAERIKLVFGMEATFGLGNPA